MSYIYPPSILPPQGDPSPFPPYNPHCSPEPASTYTSTTVGYVNARRQIAEVIPCTDESFYAKLTDGTYWWVLFDWQDKSYEWTEIEVPQPEPLSVTTYPDPVPFTEEQKKQILDIVYRETLKAPTQFGRIFNG